MGLRFNSTHSIVAARGLEAIALEGGPRCCKSSVRAAIYEAVGFLNEFFDAGLNAKG